ncbi:MAG: TonB-dependent receptor [Saprospiraceae bacterium]
MKFYLSLILFLLPLSFLLAQDLTISGTIKDKQNAGALLGVNVVVHPVANPSLSFGSSSDQFGNFSFTVPSPGTYEVEATYIGYKPFKKTITVETIALQMGTISMEEDAILLKDLEVEGVSSRGEQRGDTTQYNASAFKVNKDANAEDLVGKMPGIQVENGTVKSQGENVKRVLVDGKPFYGDDATIALKNLPAESIDKIQVFDKMSEQSQFTGFDDGNAEKTINIVTKPGFNGAKFGKVYAGYGTDDRYQAGVNENYFKDDRKIGIIAQTNNINQQNFSQEDLVGISGSTGGQGGRGPGGGGRPGGGRPGGGGDSGNFLVGNQNGISTTHSIGLNYSDKIGEKLKISGSYFFNYSSNSNDKLLNRQYIAAQDSGLHYQETNLQSSKNQNHRINLRLEYTIDSSNSIIFTPRISFQDNNQNTSLTGINDIGAGQLINKTQNQSEANNKAYTISSSLLYQHKFKKTGRSVSLDLNGNISNREGDGALNTLTEYLDPPQAPISFDQVNNSTTKSWSGSGNLSYTEPIGKISQIQLNYNPSYNHSKSEKYTYNYNASDALYSDLDSLLSNTFTNDYAVQKGGLTYRIRGKKFNANAGINAQEATLMNEQSFPTQLVFERSFKSWLPNAQFTYNFSKTSNLRFNYRTNTNAPSINQLQRVVDNTNPLQLSIGNPDLEQSYGQNIFLRFNRSNPATGRTLFTFFGFSYTNQYIGNSTFIANTDTVLPNGSMLLRGAQISQPVNLDGNVSFRTYLTYGLPIKAIKCNLNLNTGFNFARLPGLINGETNLSNTTNISQGMTLGSNISEKVDFTLNYTGNFSIVKNSIQASSNNDYFNQTIGLRFNWQFFKKWIFASDVSNTLYTGLSETYNQQYTLWNASIGRKFGKAEKLDIRIAVFDLLNQNKSINRTVNEIYIDDTQTQVLQRYGMLILTYKLNSLKK